MSEQEKPVKKEKPQGAGAPAKGAPRKGAPAQQAKGPAFQLSDGKEVKHPTPRLKKFYLETVVPAMKDEYGDGNALGVPRIDKVVVNMGVSEAKDNIQALDVAKEELALITGQTPGIRRARKSISNFKLREGMPIGLRVTLRGDRMYEFLDRLISASIPRIRDFRGLNPNAFDGTGNYNLGLKEQMIFSEINPERSLKQRGMNISIVTTAGNDAAGRELLRHLGVPFKQEGSARRMTAPAQGAR